MGNDTGRTRALVAEGLTVVASENTPYNLPRNICIHDIDIFMSSFAVTDAATYPELDGMIGDVTIATKEGDESILDATDLTALLNHQKKGGQLIDGTVADNDRQVFYWRDPLVLEAPNMPVDPALGLHGDHARTITLNHAADGAVDNRIITIHANGLLSTRKVPKRYAVFRRIVASQTAVADTNRVQALPESDRNGLHAILARLIMFGTTQIPDAEGSSHIISTVRQVDYRVNQNTKLRVHFAMEQAIQNAATDAGVDSVMIDNGSMVIDYLRFTPSGKWEDLLDVTEDTDLQVLEGAANTYRIVAQELFPKSA